MKAAFISALTMVSLLAGCSPAEYRQNSQAAPGLTVSKAPRPNDNVAFAEFREKAAAWREMRPKPQFPEGALRYKILAEEAIRNKDFDGAASFYEQALAIHPLWPEGQFKVALLYGDAGLFDKAIGHMKRYLELTPNAPEAPMALDKIQTWTEKALSAKRQ